MKHRIVHTLQKYLLNPPMRLAWICLAGNKRAKNREATTQDSGR
jgi:hypothetical protein